MILYRIINEEEYNAIQNGTISSLKKIPANKYYDQINRVYESDSIENDNQYLYFFEDVEACENGWNGEYIIQVDIPEELLEKGYGKYASLSSAFSRYIIMDELRIKKENFDKEKHLLEIASKEEIPEKWRKTSHKYCEAVKKGMEQRYLCLNIFNFEEYNECPITVLDASGLRGDDLNVFTISDELTNICKKINEFLINSKKINNLGELKTQEYIPSNIYLLNESRYTVQGMLKEMLKHYTPEQIDNLFDGDLSVNRIFDIASIMITGEIQLSDGYQRYIGDSSRDYDIKYLVASILARNDISEEKYNAIRHEIIVIFSNLRDLGKASEKTKIDCVEFIFNEENREKIPVFSKKYFKKNIIEDIVDVFTVNPDCGKEAAEYFFILGNDGKYKGSHPRISFYKKICKEIENFNKINPDSQIENIRPFKLIKKLDEIGVNLDEYNKNIRKLESSDQLLEFLSQSGSKFDNIEELLQQFELLPKKTQERPSELPYSNKRIAEGVESINSRDLESKEQCSNDEIHE